MFSILICLLYLVNSLFLLAFSFMEQFLGEKCTQSLLREFNVADTECVSLLASKVIGILMICGSFAIKIPQMINIVKSKSVEGISAVSFYMEVVFFISTVAYSYRQDNPIGFF